MSGQQNFANHAKIVPAFHFFILPALVINLAIQVYELLRYPPLSPLFVLLRVFGVLLAGALLALAIWTRLFALGVQDRVIRLEERLRYQQLLPEDLKSRIDEFTINQLVSLRFASDAELPSLARKVLDEKLNNRKVIKRLVKNWRPDNQRI